MGRHTAPYVHDSRESEAASSALRRRDLGRRVNESFHPEHFGRERPSSRELLHPPLTVRPRTAQARLENVTETPSSAERPPRPAPKPRGPLPAMEEMHARTIAYGGKQVFTLCATEYETNNTYITEQSRFIRIATPNTWRQDRAAADAAAEKRSVATKQLLKGMRESCETAATEENAEAQEELTRSSSAEAASLKASGDPARAAAGANAAGASSRSLAESQRSVWKACPDPKFSNVPRCASMRPATAPSYTSTYKPTRYSRPGSKVYKRPESAGTAVTAKSRVAESIMQRPSTGRIRERGQQPMGFSSYCDALSTLNRDMRQPA